MVVYEDGKCVLLLYFDAQSLSIGTYFMFEWVIHLAIS